MTDTAHTIDVTRLNHIGLSEGFHNHHYHQLLLGVRGRTVCGLGAIENTIAPDLCCLVPAGQAHGYHGLAADTDILAVNIDPAGPLAASLNTLAEAPVVDRLFDAFRFVTVDPTLGKRVQHSVAEMARLKPSPWQQVHQITGLLSAVDHCLGRSCSDSPVYSAPNKLSIPHLNQLIDKHLSAPLSVSEMAYRLHLSDSYFYALCQQQLGMTPLHYAQQRRIAKAQHLLQSSDLSVTDIAYELGFSSPSDFSRVFKKRLHCTPRQYKSVS